MKRLSILFIVMILGTTMTIAQNRDRRNFDPKERAEATTKQLDEVLDLTKDQEKKIYELNLKSNQEMVKMREEMQGGNGMEGMREKMSKVREENNKEMKKILTEEQWVKYEKWEKERRSRRGQGQRGQGQGQRK